MPKTLLLVDDDADFLSALSGFLSGKGYRVLTAPSGDEGLKTAKSDRPDLFILDVSMPGMDGYALCSALKQADATFDTPVVFLSGNLEAGDMLRGYYAGAHEYLTKPVDRGELHRKIVKLIGA